MFKDEFGVVEFSERKNNQKELSKKSIIIWSIIVLIIIILSIYFSSISSTDDYYILLDNNKMITYDDGIFSYVTDNDYLKSNYKVFNQNKYIGSYYISKVDDFTNEVYFTTPMSSDSYIFEKPLLAISDNIEVVKYDNLEFYNDDFDIFYNISSKDYIVKKSDIHDYSKVVLDFDNDNELETFYAVTYERVDDKLNSEFIHEWNYSLLYYVDDGNTILLSEGEPYYIGESIVFPSYLVRAVLDIDSDGYYEVVVQNRMYEIPVYEFYSLKDGKYQLVFSTRK